MKGFYCEVVVTEQIANDFVCCKTGLSRALSVGGCHNSLTDSASRDDEESRKKVWLLSGMYIYISRRLPSLSTKPLLPYEPTC